MNAYLVLENGMIFEGQAIGGWPLSDVGEAIGELVFTTGMTGYLETLTDPSYAGQIIMQTFPMIGNYGVISADFEGKCFAKGYVVHELCEAPSNFRSEGTLDTFLREQGIPGICGVDTRALTRMIRENGVMNACLCREIPEDLSPIRDYRIGQVVKQVSTKKKKHFEPTGAENGETLHVAVVDYGAKSNIIRSLQERGCKVTLLPHDTTAMEILAMAPDGLMLSNGPGDPAENGFEIRQLKKLIGKLPIFGICLGHQLTALAMGGKTYKLKYGHRGANQPVTDGKRTWITTQNHGYAVDTESMKGIARLSFRNVNDGSCEGLDYPGKRCFTVQFHPEACAGPHDTAFLFDRFFDMMKGKEV